MLTPDELQEVEALLRDARQSYAAITRWMATRGWQVKPEHVRSYALHVKLRTRRPSPSMKIDALLKPEDRKAYEALLADRRTTLTVARAWLKERGYDVGSKSVGTYRRRFLDKLDSVRDSARMAEAIVEIAREKGSAVITDGMLSKCEQVLMEQFTRLPERGDIDARTLSELCRSVGGAVAARETFEDIRRRFDEDKRKAADAGVAAAQSGATPREVAERVREILGV